ncbi:hypothetical protein AB0M28_11155 [Streptomyces sp. NPDC051940]|uniref:hypothetical protein n=1 Tax=Streptomyces sp. NPDC051940 TaxID=3155675 RepID=UPI0034453699
MPAKRTVTLFLALAAAAAGGCGGGAAPSDGAGPAAVPQPSVGLRPAPQVVEPPARETLATTEALPRGARPASDGIRRPSAAPGSAPPVPPSPRESPRSRPEPAPESTLARLCALGKEYGRWEPDSSQAKLCDRYGN